MAGTAGGILATMSDTSSHKIKPGDHLYLIDGSGYIFRAYHALPPLTRKSDGLPVGAVQGFCNMLNKLLRETNAGERPTHLAVIFDKSSKTFRNRIYPEYKAQRPPPPEDLVPQFGLIKQATEAFNVPAVEQDDFEADDLIATYAAQAREAGATVRIVSSDKDLMQLVGEGVVLYDTMKDREIGTEEVLAKFGVSPDKVIEVQALAGDSVDNIPGVPGIGVKTGAQLIEEYGDLETLLARAEEIKQPKRRQNLIEFAEQARVSRELVTLRQDVPVEVPLEEFAVRAPDAKTLIGFLKALEFNTLTRRIASEIDAEAGEIEAVRGHGQTLERAGAGGRTADVADTGEGADAGLGAARERATIPVDHSAYETVTTMAALNGWIAEAQEAGVLAVDTETTSLDAMQADLAGISLATRPGRACYIPVGHRSGEGLDFGGNDARSSCRAMRSLRRSSPCWKTRACSRSVRTSSTT